MSHTTSFFDYDELDRLDARYARLSPMKLKAIAMKFRHKTVGASFPKKKVSEKVISEHSTPLLTGATQLLDGPDNWLGLKGIFLHPFCIPLVCVPLGILSPTLGFGDGWTFWLNFLALIPLAKILGDATEELAASLQSDTISGLLNATFGNAVEMIVAVQSIRANLLDVVKASLLGSVISNILLVLGMSFLFGGFSPSRNRRGRFHSFKGEIGETDWKRRLVGFEKEQKFPVKSAQISVAMLLFATMTFVLPSIFNALPSGIPHRAERVLEVSRIGAWITMSSYLAYLIFQLATHAVTLQLDEKMVRDQQVGRTPALSDCNLDPWHGPSLRKEEEDDENEESASLDTWVSLALMAACTVVVAVNSELLVASITNVVEGSGFPMGFIGVILLPIAGNACEHASAIRFAMRDRPGLAIGICVGSSTQVALLVVPFSVIAAQCLGRPLDLDFGVLNTAVVAFSILVVMVLLMNGRSNWFQGYILIAMYCFIAVLYWYIPPGFGDQRVGA